MKNYAYIRLVLLSFILVFLSSCKPNEDVDQTKQKLIGTWQLIAVKINDAAVSTHNFPEYIQFTSNQLYFSYEESSDVLVRGGWSFESGMLNISVDLPAAYYVLKAENNDLHLKRYDFSDTGNLDATVLEYQLTDGSKIPNN